MNLAVFVPNWLGDVVMATPALRALRRQFATAHLVGVVRPYVAGVLEGGQWFDRTIVAPRRIVPGVLGVARELRRLGIDLAVLFPNSFRSAATAWLAGCKRIVGYARGGRSWLLTDRLTPVGGPRGRFVPSPIIDAYNRLAEQAGCSRPGYRMELYTTPQDEARAEFIWRKFGLNEAARVIALNPGAAFGSAKCWPIEHFVELARRLGQEVVDGRQTGVLVLCGPAERELAQRIVRDTRRPGVFSLADEEPSIGLTKACVRRADLLITTDSGPRHFAAAFERPVVTLFGPTHIAWTETYYAKAKHLQKAVECGPCQLRVCPLDHRCMKLLTPGEVYETAAALLRRFPRAAAHDSWSWLPFRRSKRAS